MNFSSREGSDPTYLLERARGGRERGERGDQVTFTIMIGRELVITEVETSLVCVTM